MNAILLLIIAALAAGAHWIDREAGLSMLVAEGFAVDAQASNEAGVLVVDSEVDGAYRVCSVRRGPDGGAVAATIRERGNDRAWVQSVCEDTAYPPGLTLRTLNYLVGATDENDLGPRHSCVVSYEIDDPELIELNLSYVMRQSSVQTAGDDVVIMNCSLSVKDEAAARAHWADAEAAFVAMRGSLRSERP